LSGLLSKIAFPIRDKEGFDKKKGLSCQPLFDIISLWISNLTDKYNNKKVLIEK